MAITILPPVTDTGDVTYPDSDMDSMSVDSDGGVNLEPGQSSKQGLRMAGLDISTGVVTPGEVVTDDPQWMRYSLLSLLTITATSPSRGMTKRNTY